MKTVDQLFRDFFSNKFQLEVSSLTPEKIIEIQSVIPLYVLIPACIDYFKEYLGKGVLTPISTVHRLSTCHLKDYLRRLYKDFDPTLSRMQFILSTELSQDKSTILELPAGHRLHHYVTLETALKNLCLINFLLRDIPGQKVQEDIPIQEHFLGEAGASFQFALTPQDIEKLSAIQYPRRVFRTNGPANSLIFLDDITHNNFDPEDPKTHRHKVRLGRHKDFTVQTIDLDVLPYAIPIDDEGNDKGIGIYQRMDKPHCPPEKKKFYSRPLSLSLYRPGFLEPKPYGTTYKGITAHPATGPILDPEDTHFTRHYIYNSSHSTVARPYEHMDLALAREYCDKTIGKTQFPCLDTLEEEATKGNRLTESLGRIRFNIESSAWGIFGVTETDILWGHFMATELRERVKKRELALGHPWDDRYEIPLIYLFSKETQNAYDEAREKNLTRIPKETIEEVIHKAKARLKAEKESRKGLRYEELIFLPFIDNPIDFLTLVSSETSNLPIPLTLIQQGWFDFSDTLFAKIPESEEMPKNCIEYLMGAKLKLQLCPSLDLNFALLEASKQRNLAMVKTLLECGAAIEITNKFTNRPHRENPLQCAVQKGYLPIVKILCDTISDNSPPDLRESRHRWISYARKQEDAPLLEALGTTEKEAEKETAEMGGAGSSSSSSPPPIISALTPGQLALRALPQQSKNTLLLEKTCLNEIEKVQDLLLAGANVNTSSNSIPAEGSLLYHLDTYTPLMVAIFSTDPDLKLIQLLLKAKANPNILFLHENRSLILSVINLLYRDEMLEILKLLLNAGADPNYVPKDSYHHPISSAAETGNLKACEMLIQKKANFKLNFNNKKNPILAIAKKGTAKLFLKAGADPYQENDEGKSAISIAAIHSNEDAIKAMIEAGVDLNREDSTRETPLSRLVSLINPFYRYSKDQRKTLLLILKGGAVPRSATEKEKVLMHLKKIISSKNKELDGTKEDAKKLLSALKSSDKAAKNPKKRQLIVKENDETHRSASSAFAQTTAALGAAYPTPFFASGGGSSSSQHATERGASSTPFKACKTTKDSSSFQKKRQKTELSDTPAD